MNAAQWPTRYEVDSATGCWQWTGRTTGGRGYGRCKKGGKTIGAHRAFYELHVGPIPPGLVLHHKCENPPCVNPEHLEPVTYAVNAQLGAASILTEEQAREVRAAVDQLCAQYGIRPRTLAAIGERKIWKGV